MRNCFTKEGYIRITLRQLKFMLFPLYGIPIVDKGYLLEDGLLFLTDVFFISCFFRLQLLSLSCEGALKFILSLCQLLFCLHLLYFLVMKQLLLLS